MAKVAKRIKFHLTTSLQAGVTALEELRASGYISTSTWIKIETESINNNGPYTTAYRTMFFILKDGLHIEVKVSTFKNGLHDTVNKAEHKDRKRTWTACGAYIEGPDRMERLIKSTHSIEWTRWNTLDKPLSGEKWREPTIDELAAYNKALMAEDAPAMLKIYFSGPIDWRKRNEAIGPNPYWLREVLQSRDT